MEDAELLAYNATVGVEEGPATGYHETLTVAWARFVAVAITGGDAHVSSLAFCRANPELLEKTALRRFYTRACMLSPGAKEHFVEPDREPLPHPR